MNEKIKGILHTSWNEPRHFFLWLALLSVSGLGIIVAATGLSNPSQTLALMSVVCGIIFLLSISAFVLAWIPPVGRLFTWLLVRRFLVLGCLVTLVALFYAVEDWRGRSAWRSFKARHEAQGERFEFASLVPAPVPADRNFFETPLWDDLHFVRTNDVISWSDTNWGSHVTFNAFGPNGGNSPGTGNWTKSQRVDLAAWQAFYRGTNNVFAAKNGPPTNYFPVAESPQSPAADVLLALSRFDRNRQLLIAAAARPEARFWINYESGPAMLLPHLARLKGSAQYLSLHANAALKAGQKQTSLEDLRLGFRLLDSIRREPILISQLVRMAALQIILQPVWEGMADRQWTEADLAFLENELGRLDFLTDYQTAMRGERGCNLWAVDYIRKGGLTGWEELTSSDRENSTPDVLGRYFGQAVFALAPAGWFDQNKLSLCRIHEDYILPAADDARHSISPGWVATSESAFGRTGRTVYDMFSKLLLPSYSRAIERFARAQASVDLARVACAIERYRLANGRLPETLEMIAPQFLPKTPPDIIDGNPLKYRRASDDQFILYSVGWNETDDGGKVELKKQGNVDVEKGDWAWRYSAG